MARKKQPDLLNDGPKIGHNSNLNADEKQKLSGLISEIEHHEAEKREIVASIGSIYARAKEQGFDTKAMRHVVKMRRMESNKRKSLENAIDVYMHALGMLADTPLGAAAVKRDFGAQPVGNLANEIISDLKDPPFAVPPDEPAHT